MLHLLLSNTCVGDFTDQLLIRAIEAVSKAQKYRYSLETGNLIGLYGSLREIPNQVGNDGKTFDLSS